MQRFECACYKLLAACGSFLYRIFGYLPVAVITDAFKKLCVFILFPLYCRVATMLYKTVTYMVDPSLNKGNITGMVSKMRYWENCILCISQNGMTRNGGVRTRCLMYDQKGGD